ncbi:4-amino-4-deoxy-L-arabinose transferase-like glycosyltransferase [Sinomonas atrocyanea]|uniref:ArnT family glycosyltransferase n=1 Tax=Sinomonas atrocyanea TaxID=37927 RepID=UPI002785D793|nr:glycosyltransferase family 39 protein [Sinomonas atrocyanea]MDP9882729.1 4-amino-4-deoxy-L-arabinose transferase-like glycosyltransferase [Sinomonas atrocyanea]
MASMLRFEPPGAPPRRPGRPGASSWRSRPAGPRAERAQGPGAVRRRAQLAAVLAAITTLYLWNLTANGWANAFYSAAAQAGSQNWEAFFFGSSDAGNSITVDKPPASLWIVDLSVRVFGLSSASILVPEVLMGVATAWILYLAVRRAVRAATGSDAAGHRGGLLAAVVLALTPVAALMFRFNNPDALLVLLMTASGYAVVRSVQDGRARWLIAAGALLGLGFLAKQLQVLLVVPGFGLAYLWAAPHPLRRRLLHLLGALGAVAAAAGWWILAVELTPAGSRPFIGGSQTNSILELTFGYNGFGRLDGNEVGSVGGGNGWGRPGLFRLFSDTFGGQIAWLLPTVLILGAALLWVGRRAPRTDPVRASVIVWGGWVLVTGLTFSLMAGIIHEYYSVALAPGIAALAGTGAGVLWHRRSGRAEAAVLAAAVLAAGVTGAMLLGRATGFVPWLPPVVAAAGIVAAFGMAAGPFGLRLTPRWTGWASRTTASLALVAGLAGSLAFTLQTVSTPHTGAIVSAGPSSGFGVGGPGGFGGRRQFIQGQFGLSTGGPAAGGFGPQGGASGGFGGRGGGAGLLGASTPSSALVAALTADAAKYTWAAAVVGSNNAAGYQLATGQPAMALGGFNGTDPSPTLEQFQQLVADGRVHWFIAASLMGGDSGSDAARQIAQWVEANYTAQTIGGKTVYQLG